MTNLKKILIITSIIISTTFITITSLVFSKNKLDNSFCCSSNDLITKIAIDSVRNKETELSIEELNVTLNMITSTNISLFTTNKKTLNLYIPITFHNIDTAITAEVNLVLQNDNIEITILKTKIGKLPVPKNFLMGIIKNNIPKTVAFDKNKIYINPVIPIMDNKIKIKITKLNLIAEKNKVILKTTANLDEIKMFLNKITSLFF